MSSLFLMNGRIKCATFCIVHNLNKLNLLKRLNTYTSNPATEKENSKTLKQTYQASDIEAGRYESWESKNYFKPTKSENDSFLVLLPPPNVTGTLHLGHALTCTIQDVILRWKRMKGESVLWVPGIDHAGIATQAAVEKHLQQTLGLSKHDLGKEEFLKVVWEWKNEKTAKIIEQLRKLGASLDWSKLIFTMDSSHSQLVTNSFIQLYNDGLIYRKESLVNWSCTLNSSISDIEVDWVTVDKATKFTVPGYDKPISFGYLYEFAYKVCDEDYEVIVSTTRPETMLGDVAVAIHPSDPKVSKLQNKHVWHPFRNEKIPIIVDEFVDPNFGTGAVKITPSHSPTDFEVGVKHNLKLIHVINEAGFINKVGTNEKLHDLKRFDARWAIVNELKNLNLFRGSKPHSLTIPVCSRSGDVVEFLAKEQWFLKTDSFVEKAMNAVKNGELKLQPESYNNVWYKWLSSSLTKEWNLSRQLLWGHKIPMYECKFKDEKIWLPGLSLEDAKSKAAKNFNVPLDSITVAQDPDVLDTWFSSGLLSLNSVIRQKRRPPISLMVTGHDILFFWIARMVMLSVQLTGELPFKEVFLHSLICDAHGKKMSKSLGNVIHPDDIIKGLPASEMENRLKNTLKEGQISNPNYKAALASIKTMFPQGIPECGTDALRFTLCSGSLQICFFNFDVHVCLSNKFFCNKIYQAFNYYLKMTERYKEVRSEFSLPDIKSRELNCFDRWILSRLAGLVKCVNKALNSYKFDEATNAIRIFFVNDFCSFYLESTKPILSKSSPLQFNTTFLVFFWCLETFLRLLCPFMPFITEHLYEAIPTPNGFDKCESVTVAKYPDEGEWAEFVDEGLESRIQKVSELLTALRRTNVWFHLKKKQPNVFVKCSDSVAELLFGEMKDVFQKLGDAGNLSRVEEFDRRNVIRQKVSKDLIAFTEHMYDKTTLQNFFNPEMLKEEKLNKSLEKLKETANAPKWEEMKPSERYLLTKEINKIKSELEKIEIFKFALDNCDR